MKSSLHSPSSPLPNVARIHVQFAFIVALLSTTLLTAQRPIGFEERFALAKDRGEVLKELIPGTTEYYYYHALYAQQQGESERVYELLAEWDRHHDADPLPAVLKTRQLLIDYKKHPERTVAELIDLLSPYLAYEQNLPDEALDLPMRLDPKVLNARRLISKALAKQPGLQGITSAGLRQLDFDTLSPPQRRQFLSRLSLPDYPNLASRLVADLRRSPQSSFGRSKIHQLLTLTQLDECLALMPELLNSDAFVEAYLQRLAPHADADFQRDREALRLHLERLHAFAVRLPPTQNSFKAHVLYQRLQFDRSAGVYDSTRFIEYLKVPRRVSYNNAQVMRRDTNRRYAAQLTVDPEWLCGFDPIGSDWLLVKDYLHHLLAQRDSANEFSPYIDKDVLRTTHAEAKILAAGDDLERWYTQLNDPKAYERIKDRVEIAFTPRNRRVFGSQQAVEFEVALKNVPTLLVKIYRVNAFNYYRQTGEEISANLPLDGLVANHEHTFEYTMPQWQRHTQKFAFEELSDPGTYIVEFIGNGKGSRAVVQKGHLHHTERLGAAGHVFRVFDDTQRPIPEARLWLSGREFTADEHGEIVVPYSQKPGQQSAVLSDGSGASARAALIAFRHRAELYELESRLHVERESLVVGHEAPIIVRPRLTLHGEEVAIELLENAELLVSATHGENTTSQERFPLQSLRTDRELVQTFRVPKNLTALTLTLKGSVNSLTQGKPQQLLQTRSYSFSAIEHTPHFESALLVKSSDGFTLEVRGKTGEPRAHVAVKLTLSHRFVTTPISVELQTDLNGQIELGALPNVTTLSTKLKGQEPQEWSVGPTRLRLPARLQVREGAVVQIACDTTSLESSDWTLLEAHTSNARGVFLKDRSAQAKLRAGRIDLEGLTAGSYLLSCRRTGESTKIRVAQGKPVEDTLLAAASNWQLTPHRQLHIESTELDGDQIVIRLAATTAATRCHVLGFRYLPANSAADRLAVSRRWPSTIVHGAARASYLTGRELGDEYRYILERRRSPHFAGNMLERPGLLLNPWSKRKTVTGIEELARGGNWDSAESSPGAVDFYGSEFLEHKSRGAWANLDFLAHSAVLLSNLTADAQGVVRIPREQFAHSALLRVIAVDPSGCADRELPLPLPPLEANDLTLRNALAADVPASEQRRVSVVRTNDPIVFDSAEFGQLETFDSLSRVFDLFLSISPNPTLSEFSFVKSWPQKSFDEKCALYSKYACHELHFFLSQKDPEFFAQVVEPYLAYKKEKTFFDHYLLGHDLNNYLDPWRYQKLNALEKILLASRIEGDASITARNLREAVEADPLELGQYEDFFKQAILGRSLSSKDELQQLQRQLKNLPAARRVNKPSSLEAQRSLGAAPKRAFDMEAPAEESADSDLRDASRLRARRAGRGREQRKRVRRFYQNVDPTEEWAENNYYHVEIGDDLADLIEANAFWRDYALHRSQTNNTSFISGNLAAFAESNFASMLCALAVLDLPFDSAKHPMEVQDGRLTLTPQHGLLAFRKEIAPLAERLELPILVSQSFFRNDDRYEFPAQKRGDKFVTKEFLTHVAYGCQVVVTNTTSSQQQLDILLQIPKGSIPLDSGFVTRGQTFLIGAYTTKTFEYHFYFPAEGSYPAFPVHVSKEQQHVGAAAPLTFKVVRKPTVIDTLSWQYVSQQGSADEVFAYLESHNLQRMHQTGQLEKLAWRLRQRQDYESFGKRLLKTLDQRHIFDEDLWAFALAHGDAPRIRQYLSAQEECLELCGSWLKSPLIDVDFVDRQWIEHLEYSPLVNARAHTVGPQRKILNNQFSAHYHELLAGLCYKPSLDSNDSLAICYYLLLQDRVQEALDRFATIRRRAISSTLQYDYMKAYLSFFSADPEQAREIATRYQEYPVLRWRKRFSDVVAHLDEARGATPIDNLTDNGALSGDQLAASEPTFEFVVDNRQIQLSYQNVTRVEVNYYLMDIELLFSSQPFVRSGSGQGVEQWAAIQPLRSERHTLDRTTLSTSLQVPEEFQASNVIVEVVAHGRRQAQAYYANSLNLQLVENYGQVRVTNAAGRVLPRTYVKVYARGSDGQTRFYKDGYTDIRGRFDYASISHGSPSEVKQFSLLIMSENEGALIREASPPKM